jgi:hypothetical protein
MKGLVNKSGKLMAIRSGKVVESNEDPTTFPDDVTLEHKMFEKVDMSGLKMVDLDVIIDKPKPRYQVAKK